MSYVTVQETLCGIVKERQYSSLSRSQTQESQGDWALTWEAGNSGIFALAGCPNAALAAGQGWSLSVRGDKSLEAVRPLYRNSMASGVSIIANLRKATVLLRGPQEVGR